MVPYSGEPMELNAGQTASLTSMYDFINSNERYMRFIGAAGTGKTFLIDHFVKYIHKQNKIREAINLPITKWDILFTATTNKATEAFENALGREVKTIHSTLRLVMQEDPKTLKDILWSSRPHEILSKKLIFLDESSYVDMDLLLHIEAKLDDSCKVIFMGDSAQCKSAGAGSEITADPDSIKAFVDHYKVTDLELPVFNMDIREASLTQIMRQSDGNPIQEVSTALRNAVINKSGIPPAKVDGKHIIWLPRNEFENLLIKDMTNTDWDYHTSKYLAYTNKRVNHYNKLVYSHLHNTPDFKVNDYAVNNEYVPGNKSCPSIGTDRLVLITGILESEQLGYTGHQIWTDSNREGSFSPKTGAAYTPYFLPHDRTAKDKVLNKLRKKIINCAAQDSKYFELKSNFDMVKGSWVDFRPAFGCTVYKSQGSTFRRVFLDLGDINMCYDADQKIRMLYVGFSRARMQVFMTGDIT